MPDLLQHIRSVLERDQLVPAGVRLLVGVSGGADSTALLHLLHRLDIDLVAAHLHHGIRGAEADADEAFVRDLCALLGIRCIAGRADVLSAASTPGLSIEMAAREARFAFFRNVAAELAREGSPVRVALGHHGDDQIETFFLRAARGAGSGGLGGMKTLQRIGDLTLIRPLLEIRREDLLRWLQDEQIAWREDSTNQDQTLLRNAIRHQLLPLLRGINPQAGNNILRAMQILREDDALLDALAQEARDPSQQGPLPLAVQRRVVCRQLIENGLQPAFDLVERVLAFSQRTDGTHEMDLGSVCLINEYGRLRFVQPGEESRLPPPERAIQIAPGRGILREPWRASVSAARVSGRTVVVRAARPGDRMAPYGMNGRRKLQDILTDLKIPKKLRIYWPVAECDGEIIWVPGYRIAAGWDVPDETSPALHLSAPDLKKAWERLNFSCR